MYCSAREIIVSLINTYYMEHRQGWYAWYVDMHLRLVVYKGRELWDMSGKSWMHMENDTQPVKNEDEREFYDTNFNCW